MAVDLARRGRPRPYSAEVRRVERRTPHFLRVTLGGGELSRFTWPGPGSHLKIFLPEAGQDHVVLPPPGPDGLMQIEPGGPRPVTRTFTPRSFDADRAELDIEFVLHGDGPAAQWAAAAELGDQIAVSQPRRTYEIAADSEWLVLAGDESALPAIGTILDTLEPGLAKEVFIEVAGPDHELDPGLRSEGVPVRWIHRPAAVEPGAALAGALESWQPPAGVGQVWSAGEATAVRRIRRHLLETLRLDPDRILTRGYWRLGTSNHPDHDYGEGPT